MHRIFRSSEIAVVVVLGGSKTLSKMQKDTSKDIFETKIDFHARYMARVLF